MKQAIPDGGRDPIITRLVSTVDQLQHRLKAQEEAGTRQAAVAASHTRTLTDLAALLNRGAAARPAASADKPVEWLTNTSPQAAVTCLLSLQLWVRTVWSQYEPITSCWRWHPTVIAELVASQRLWTNACDPDAAPDAYAAWHDRWRPGTHTRITTTLNACTRQGDDIHVAPDTKHYRIDTTVLDEIAVWWATTHGSTPAPGLAREDSR